jgi:uncharacterized membrane protein (DUF485 family)
MTEHSSSKKSVEINSIRQRLRRIALNIIIVLVIVLGGRYVGYLPFLAIALGWLGYKYAAHKVKRTAAIGIGVVAALVAYGIIYVILVKFVF